MEDFEIQTRERLTALEQGLKTIDERVDKIDEIVTSIKEVVIELKQMRTDVNRIDKKVTEIESKPAKRLDTITVSIISAIISFIAGYFLPHLMGGG